MKKFTFIVTLICFISFNSFSDESQERQIMEALIYSQLSIDGNITQTPPSASLNAECDLDYISLKSTANNSFLETLLVPSNNRCEFKLENFLRREKTFDLSFNFRVSDLRREETISSNDFSILRVYNKQDKNEASRCPLLILQSSVNGLTMYNRWDENKTSSTPNGNCAEEGNSIQERTVFENLPYNINSWHKLSISGKLSYENDTDACLVVSFDDYFVSEICGPNTYYDYYHPYIKLGSNRLENWTSGEELQIHFDNITYYQY